MLPEPGCRFLVHFTDDAADAPPALEVEHGLPARREYCAVRIDSGGAPSSSHKDVPGHVGPEDQAIQNPATGAWPESMGGRIGMRPPPVRMIGAAAESECVNDQVPRIPPQPVVAPNLWNGRASVRAVRATYAHCRVIRIRMDPRSFEPSRHDRHRNDLRVAKVREIRVTRARSGCMANNPACELKCILPPDKSIPECSISSANRQGRQERHQRSPTHGHSLSSEGNPRPNAGPFTRKLSPKECASTDSPESAG